MRKKRGEDLGGCMLILVIYIWMMIVGTIAGIWMTESNNRECEEKYGKGSKYEGATYLVPGKVIDKLWCRNAKGERVPL